MALTLALAVLAPVSGCRADDEPLLESEPYLGMWCPRVSVSASECDRVGLAVRLERPAAAVTATISGEPMELKPSAPGASGHYWYGFVQRSALDLPSATRQRHAEVTIRVGDRSWGRAMRLREGATRRAPAAEIDRGRWRVLPPVPPGRGDGYGNLDAVRVGRRAVVVAGASYDARRVNAFAFDPLTNRWTRPSPAPLGSRAGAAVVAARGRVLVLGGAPHTGTGASYDPARNTWRRLEPAPALGRTSHTAVWTGSRVLLWGGQARRGPPLASGVAYDPRGKRWSAIARPPLLGRSNHSAIWTGRRMIVWGGQIDAVQDDVASYVSDGAAYHPERDSWERIAPAPIRSTVDTRTVWTGSRMLVWTGNQGASYDPGTDRWRLLPRAPIKPRGGLQSAVWAGGRLIVWGGVIRGVLGQRDGAAYDPDTHTWTRLRSAPIRGRDRHAAVALGDDMLIWGGCCRGSARLLGDGAIYSPAEPPPRRAAYHRHQQLLRGKDHPMSRLIRLDASGHSTLAEWTTADDAAFDAAVREFHDGLEQGYIGVLDQGEGSAEQLQELPRDVGLVIMRRPIAGG